MLLRRELDQQAGAENLRNLLHDISEHPGVLTRSRYRAQWGDGRRYEQQLADRAFDSFNPRRAGGDPGDDYIDPDIVRADLAHVVTDAERLREHAERTRAHRAPPRGIDTPDITFRALHTASAEVRRVIGKYYTLLTLRIVTQWEPVFQYNTISPFTRPWVTNPQAITAAPDEGERE